MIESASPLSVHIRTPTINSALYITVEDIRLTSKTSNWCLVERSSSTRLFTMENLTPIVGRFTSISYSKPYYKGRTILDILPSQLEPHNDFTHYMV